MICRGKRKAKGARLRERFIEANGCGHCRGGCGYCRGGCGYCRGGCSQLLVYV